MNAQMQLTRRPVAEPNQLSSTRADRSDRKDSNLLRAPANDHVVATPHEERRVDPLWMITAAAALLFLFLAVAATVG
jgi:hypothetical protein